RPGAGPGGAAAAAACVRGRRVRGATAGRGGVSPGRGRRRALPAGPERGGVRIGSRTVAILVLALAVVVALALRGQSSGDSPEHRTDSDAANGASALPQ